MRVPKYRRHKGVNRGFIEYQRKRTYLPGPYNSPESLAAYEQFVKDLQIANLLQDRRERQLHAPAELAAVTVGELVVEFLAYAEDYYGPVGEFQNFRAAAAYLLAKHLETRVRDLGPRSLNSLQEWMITQPCRDGRGQPLQRKLSKNYINACLRRIKQIFSWGVGRELVPELVYLRIKEVKGLRLGKGKARETSAVEPVAWEDVQLIKPYVPAVIWDMITVHYLTGMRSGELTSLTPGEIDMSGGVWLYAPKKHKTRHHGKKKLIYFGPQAQAILQRYLTRETATGTRIVAADEYLFRPVDAMAQRNRKTKHLRPRYTTDSYRQAINYAFDAMSAAAAAAVQPSREAEAEQLPLQPVIRWHPHQLRHTRLTETRARYGIEGAQAQSGNTLEAAEIYAESSRELAERIARETG